MNVCPRESIKIINIYKTQNFKILDEIPKSTPSTSDSLSFSGIKSKPQMLEQIFLLMSNQTESKNTDVR